MIWRYHHIQQTPVPGDVIVALGTNDLRVAEFAASLYHRGFGRKLVCTGGIAHQGDLLETPWHRPEAEMFADVAVRHGVPRGNILLEPRATNTSENLLFTRELLEHESISAERIVLAVKPFMQRRTWATMQVVWPEVSATVASPEMTLDEYFSAELLPEKVIHILMGDLQRLWIYGKRGWSVPQQTPGEVQHAFDFLKRRGFTRHLLTPDR